MTNSKLLLISIFLFQTTLILSSCGSKTQENKAEAIPDELQKALQDSVSKANRKTALLKKYGKIWELDSLNFLYTSSYQKALKSTTKVLLDAGKSKLIVLDMWSTDTSTLALIEEVPQAFFPNRAFFQLSCDLGCVDLFPEPDGDELWMERRISETTLIVADIESAHRANLMRRCTGERDESDESGVTVWIEDDVNSAPPFVLKGKILEILE